MQMPTTQVDPITLELVHEGLIAIVREMRANVIRTAYSSVIYEGQDFSCCITDAQGQLVAKAPADNPLHIFPVPWSVRTVLDRFGGDVHPGDVFLHNDPYTGGTHLNDVATIYPIFVAGQLFAFAVVRQHWGDVGGMTPGSISGQATEIFQEGVRIPAIRVYDEGRPNQAALDLIFANVRGVQQRQGDFTAALVSCQQAGRKLDVVVRRYGLGTVRDCMDRFLERADARMRQGISAIPDGTYAYEAYVESTGRALEPLLVALTVRVSGDTLVADFSGSSPQSPGPMNVGPAMAPTGFLTVAKSYLDPTVAVNEGAWRALRVENPEGSFLNARQPAACGGMSEIMRIVGSAAIGALAAAIPESATGDNRGTANHTYIGSRGPHGEQYIFYEYPAGGCAAYYGGDGNSVTRNFQEGDFTTIQPVEAVENEHPLLVERCEVRLDSAGPGRWRGGFGLRREIRVLSDEALLSVVSDHNILGPQGVCGGESGAGNRFTVRREGVEIEPSPIPGKVSGFALRKGDVVIMRSAGAGGYGDPLDRPAERVWRDVADGYLSAECARTRYGVAVTPEGVDEPATVALRREMRNRRIFVSLAPWQSPEFEGPRRVLPVARGIAERGGIGEGDVVELVNPRGAPLRAWAHLMEDAGDRAYLGSAGMRALMAQPGDRLQLRRLSSWGVHPPSNV